MQLKPFYRAVPRNLTAVTLTLGVSATVQACDLCAIYSAQMARGDLGRGWEAGVAEQFTHFGTMQVDGQEVPNEWGQYLDSSMSQIFAGYRFGDRFGLQFNLPLIYRTFARPDGTGGMDRGTESGLGDASLVANLVAYRHSTRDSTLTWSLLGGLKFPTGSTDRLQEETGEIEDPVGQPSGIHGHDLTLGSGSVDAVLGTGLFARLHRGLFTANLQYAIRGQGAFDYRFANDLVWSGGPGAYVVMKDRWTLALQAVVSGEFKPMDTFQGNPAEDTGITAVYLGPQVSLTWGERLSIHLAVDIPVSIHNTALQTVADYRVQGGLVWHF